MRTLLVLDLDETLIHATETPLDRGPDFEIYGYAVYRRPHLDAFLVGCAGLFELAVWSSASDAYVEAVVDAIFPDRAILDFVWGRSRASLRRFIGPDEYPGDFDHRHYRKPLAKAKKRGWPLERILIVDDTPEKCVQNYGNAIYIRPFEGALDDAELPLLLAYLRTLADCPNVRRVEKRGWRAEACRLVEGASLAS
jgi:carboxy-terminal domain RNA polymerase II polypeptide A small phosphatase